MGFIAIIHIPDHTAGARLSPAELTAYLDADLEHSGGCIVGLYDFPKRSELTCTGNCVRKGSGAWTRDRLGFMRCAICGSRNRNVRRWLIGHLFDLLGANLMGNDAPALFRTPDGYGPSRNDG